MPGRPHVIAHRGDSAHRPENTLAAFASALEAGAALIELDVQMTRDGHAVVIHDDDVARTTAGTGRVSAMSLAELRRLSAGCPRVFGDAFAGERVPSLLEALGFLRGRARVVVELKRESIGDGQDGLAARALADVHRAGMAHDVALVSFEPEVLRHCRRLDRDVPRGHLFARATPQEMLAAAAAVGAEFVLPEKSLLSPQLFAAARAAGLHVATWLVNDPAELEALRGYDLFGIGTDDPAALLEVVAGWPVTPR